MAASKFICFEAGASADLRSLFSDIEQGAAKVKEAGFKRVLVDLMAMNQAPGGIESLLLSHHAGWHLPSLERIGVVVPERTGDGERIAQYLGTNMVVFTSRTQAEAWLNEEAAGTA